MKILKRKGNGAELLFPYYYIEVLNRLEITPEEYSKAYIEKHNSNMSRNYEKDNKEKYNKKTF